MVAQESVGPRFGVYMKSPLSIDQGNTQSLMVYVDDVDAHCAQARAAGAKIVDQPALHDYGKDYWGTAATAPSIRKDIFGGSRSAFAILKNDR
jgi:hypothetical protein